MKKRIRLFIDAHVFDDSLQGSRTYLKGLYNELISKNLSIIFLFGACDIHNLKNEFGEHENVKYIRYFARNKFVRLAIIIPYIILRYKIDISHFQYIVPLFRFSKEIVTIHDVIFLDFPSLFPSSYRYRNKLLFSLSARRADYLLTVSEYSKHRISKHFRINHENIYSLPNGIADDYFDSARILPDVKKLFNIDRYILYVSRIEPRKNHILLVKAFEELNLWRDGYKLVLIGSKALKSNLFDNYLKELPSEIRKSVLLINGSYGDELKSFYRNCSLFVYPSLAEGFGIPPLEAVASNVPVLCSDTTAMSDFRFLKERLFDPYSLSELKEKIILNINTNKRDFGNDVEFVKTRYSWKNSASLFEAIILKDVTLRMNSLK